MQHPGRFKCELVDPITDHSPFPYNRMKPWYSKMAANPWMWRLAYRYAEFYPSKRLTEETANLALHKRWAKVFREAEPDLVVSVHPLLQDLPLRVLRREDAKRAGLTKGFGYSARKTKGARTTPFVTVVTDLGSAANNWFDPGVDKCFIPGDAVRSIAKRNGMRDDALVQHGLPIKPAFWKGETRSAAALRGTLGLDQDAPTVLVVGGGDGVGAIETNAKAIGVALGASAAPRQMVVVCGKNAKARERLAKHKWAPGVSVKVEGFVNNMDEYMGAADCLVTKAGPGTIAEAATRSLPMVLMSFLPGQEVGNVPFVEDAGFGTLQKKPKAIARTVASWLDDPAKLKSMQAAAKDASRPEATQMIARDIAELAGVR